MDPNETLETARGAYVEYVRAADAMDSSGYDSSLTTLAESFNALDEWLSRGGFLPSAWRVDDVRPVADVQAEFEPDIQPVTDPQTAQALAAMSQTRNAHKAMTDALVSLAQRLDGHADTERQLATNSVTQEHTNYSAGKAIAYQDALTAIQEILRTYGSED